MQPSLGVEVSPQVAPRMVPKLMAVNAVLVLPLPQLLARIEEELSTNPAIERVARPCPHCGVESEGPVCHACGRPMDRFLYHLDAYPLKPRPLDEEEDPLSRVAQEVSLSQHLQMSLAASPLSGVERSIGEYLIGSIDERGFLDCNLQQVAIKFGVSVEVVEKVLGVVQSFDPPGIGARTVEECLLLQLRAYEPSPINLLAQRIVATSLKELASRQYAKVARALNVPIAAIREAHEYIRTHCYPHPADRYEAERMGGPRLRPNEVARPDVAILPAEDGYTVELVGASVMELRLNPLYRQLYQETRQRPKEFAPDAREHIQEQVNRAKLFIEVLRRRHVILRAIAEKVVEIQRPFLDHGPRYLKPLTKAAVASALGVSESTVSRALDGKYALLPSGRVVSMEIFFDQALPVKERIKEIIAQEDPRRPLTDQQIAAQLTREGIRIARRTVAKYREEIGIPPSAKRGVQVERKALAAKESLRLKWSHQQFFREFSTPRGAQETPPAKV